VERVRRYFEQLFGVGEERERIIREGGRRGPGPNRRLSSSGGRRGSVEAGSASASSSSAAATASAAESGTGPASLSPQEAARRLVSEREAQNRDWFARRIREVERTVALFVASLWPGVGENVVRVQEQRRRREEERIREEEERKRKEEEEKKRNDEGSGLPTGAVEVVDVDGVGGTEGEPSTSGTDVRAGEGLSKVNKGKGKATEDEVAAQEVGTSSGSVGEMMKDDGAKEA